MVKFRKDRAIADLVFALRRVHRNDLAELVMNALHDWYGNLLKEHSEILPHL